MIISNRAAEIIGKRLSDAFWEATEFGEEVQVARCWYMIDEELRKDNQYVAARVLGESFFNSNKPNEKEKEKE